jgi:hypothetical protein
MHQQDGKTNSSFLEDMMEYPVATISTLFISNIKYGHGSMNGLVMRRYNSKESQMPHTFMQMDKYVANRPLHEIVILQLFTKMDSTFLEDLTGMLESMICINMISRIIHGPESYPVQ